MTTTIAAKRIDRIGKRHWAVWLPSSVSASYVRQTPLGRIFFCDCWRQSDNCPHIMAVKAWEQE